MKVKSLLADNIHTATANPDLMTGYPDPKPTLYTPTARKSALRSFFKDIMLYMILIFVSLVSLGTIGYLFYTSIISVPPAYADVAAFVCGVNNLSLQSYDGSSSQVTCALMRPYGDYNISIGYQIHYDFKKESAKYKLNKSGGK